MPKARWLMEPTMPLKKEFSDLRLSFEPLTLYQKFEQVCVLMLTTLIAIIIALALWNLTLKILLSIWATNFDPTDYGVFQTVFGMIFTVIIALEFKRSLLVVAEGRFGKPDFVYLAKDDAYRCPAGEKLTHHFTADEDGQKMRIYLTKACR